MIWTGEISRNEQLHFPFDTIARILNSEERDSGNSNKKEFNVDANSTYIITKNNTEKKDHLAIENRIQGSSLSEISVNNLYNMMTNPESVATALIIIAAVVRCILYINETLIIYDMIYSIQKE